MLIGFGKGVAVGVSVPVDSGVGVDEGVGVPLNVTVVATGAGVFVGSAAPAVQAEMTRIRLMSTGKDFFIIIKITKRGDLLPPLFV